MNVPYVPGAPEVVSWPVRRIPPDTLTLPEIVILRRKVAGQTDREIAVHLGCGKANVASYLKQVRTRFGVDTTKELLTLPRIHELIKEQENS